MFDRADRQVLAGAAILIVAIAIVALTTAATAALAVRLFLYLSGV